MFQMGIHNVVKASVDARGPLRATSDDTPYFELNIRGETETGEAFELTMFTRRGLIDVMPCVPVTDPSEHRDERNALSLVRRVGSRRVLELDA